jgi:hypothetical protein
VKPTFIEEFKSQRLSIHHRRVGMPIKEECCLCGKVLPYYALKRCVRCKRLYCTTCLEYTEDGNIMCLNCARRIVSPPRLGTKYSPLTRFLARRANYTDTATLPFQRIEGIIGDSLPSQAYKTPEWWKNNRARAHIKAWENIGWKVENVDIEKRVATFRREKGILHTEKGPIRRARGQKKTVKPLPKATPRKKRIPSKTKMAKMVARLKNIERQRMTTPVFPGQPKARPLYEKKLFKTR